MGQLTAGESVATARILFHVIRGVLDSVMKESEDAVMKITESLNNLSELSETQKRRINEAIDIYYQGEQAESLQNSLNASASAIMDAAAKGDMARVNEIGDSEDYISQRDRTLQFHESLQEVVQSSEQLADLLMPLIISLQFQDKMKQQLVGVLRALELFMARDTVVVEGNVNFDEFWTQVQKSFNVVETRNLVLRVVKSFMTKQSA